LIEPACSLAFVGWENYNDNNDAVVKKQRMAIAILNSNSHDHVHKKSNYADYSPCHSYFHHRYAVGLHRANKDDLERFGSRKDYHEYVSKTVERRQEFKLNSQGLPPSIHPSTRSSSVVHL
jgi:hypothetical protein